MNWLLRKCVSCGRYTLAKDRCPVCGGEVRVPHPPRFSPEDKYVKYRIMAKVQACSQNVQEIQEDKQTSPRNLL
ncbi:MAG: RNA-protein complex protein Nop10 [Acidilobaceae archaeon]